MRDRNIGGAGIQEEILLRKEQTAYAFGAQCHNAVSWFQKTVPTEPWPCIRHVDTRAYRQGGTATVANSCRSLSPTSSSTAGCSPARQEGCIGGGGARYQACTIRGSIQCPRLWSKAATAGEAGLGTHRCVPIGAAPDAVVGDEEEGAVGVGDMAGMAPNSKRTHTATPGKKENEPIAVD